MHYLKQIFLMALLLLSSLNAQSYYVLSDVKSYKPLVVTEGQEFELFNKDIKLLMDANALELNINTTGPSSRVLAFIIKKFSLGETLGVRVILELAEYVRRKGSEEEVFAISYIKSKNFVYHKEALEDDLADTVEEMLEIFTTQYKDDNKNLSQKKLSEKKKIVTHETFAKDMGYENDYAVALAKAKKEGKDLMVFMTTAYCPWCRKLENRILSQRHIDKKIKARHVAVMLNFNEKKFPKNLSDSSIVPTLYVLDNQTGVIKKTFVGYASRNIFLNYLGNKNVK